MTTTNGHWPEAYSRTAIRDMIRKGAAESAKAKVDWMGGCPLSWLPISVGLEPVLHKMVKEGEIEIVSRPKTTDPTKRALYLRFVDA